MPGEKARNQASAVSGRKNILNIRQNIAEGPSINGDIEVGSVAKVALPAYCSDRVHALAERSSSATAAGNARSAATVAAKLPEPSNCPAGRRFAGAPWLGHENSI